MIIDQTTLMTYLVILLGFVFIPGPAVLLTLARATSSGTRAGVATGLGIAIGDLIHTLMAIVGISAIVMASAFLFGLIKYLGAAYLIYLGIRAICEKVDSTKLSRADRLTPQKAFKQAILIEVLNPKSALFFLAFLPQFVNPENGYVAIQLLILGILFVLMGLVSTVVVAIGAGGIGTYLQRNPTMLRWQGKITGSIYCLVGIRLALQEK